MECAVVRRVVEGPPPIPANFFIIQQKTTNRLRIMPESTCSPPTRRTGVRPVSCPDQEKDEKEELQEEWLAASVPLGRDGTELFRRAQPDPGGDD